VPLQRQLSTDVDVESKQALLLLELSSQLELVLR
jgi:hypothetical protein